MLINIKYEMVQWQAQELKKNTRIKIIQLNFALSVQKGVTNGVGERQPYIYKYMRKFLETNVY
jgi:hypothetical protein